MSTVFNFAAYTFTLITFKIWVLFCDVFSALFCFKIALFYLFVSIWGPRSVLCTFKILYIQVQIGSYILLYFASITVTPVPIFVD